MKTCRGCDNTTGNIDYVAREMMLGRRTNFDYFECSKCGSVQIAKIPSDLSEYYPSGYYSFQKPGKLKSFLKRRWASYSFFQKGPIGHLMATFMGDNAAIVAVRKIKPPYETAILDVGCGGGDLLRDLQSLGFSNLKGADPYNEKEIQLESGTTIWKKHLEEVDEQFNVLMLHHAFEHIYDPTKIFLEAHRILHPGGTLLIRVPVAGSYAWRHYKTNWVQLDAPRHLFIPSARCIKLLADRFGFDIDSEYYDSTEFQFWGSEQYVKDIPLSDSRSHHRNPRNLILPGARIRQFKEKAKELNELKDGDSACFYLKKR
jgi:SAM-dependent methyltransferase